MLNKRGSVCGHYVQGIIHSGWKVNYLNKTTFNHHKLLSVRSFIMLEYLWPDIITQVVLIHYICIR